MDPNEFVKQYYAVFDQDRSQLAVLYRDVSMLTFENTQHRGVASIVEKLTGLPFQKVVHHISTLDIQPTGDNLAIILVTGQLMVDGETKPLPFTQVFTLVPSPDPTNPEARTIFILNDIFRLNLS